VKILCFYIEPNWAANAARRVFTWAPEDWDELTDDQQREFENEMITEFLHNELEYGVIAYDDLNACKRKLRRAWGDGAPDNEDEVEDWFNVRTEEKE
jgi:hypothetical protein